MHYHDRFISTLAAIVALREVGGDLRDERRVKRGEDALWRLVGRLGRDDSDTVGFPVLSASLADEARALGLDVPQPPVRYAQAYKGKVQALLSRPNRNWLGSTLTFSLEALRFALQEDDRVLERNQSVSVSPSATAAYLMVKQDENALSYLLEVISGDKTGAVAAVAPVDVFEIAWSINYLRQVDAIEADDPEVRHVLDLLWKSWKPDKGVSSSSFWNVSEVDDTAACFAVLRWGGYPVSPDVFKYFEMEDHFCCYRDETNLSLSALVRLLSAVRLCEDYPEYSVWVRKIVTTLQRHDDNGSFWWDKWHASPYYVNSTAINVLHGIDNDLADSRLKWIVRTQNDDGGWGYFGQSTLEETAYCLLALLKRNELAGGIEADILDAADQYLEKNGDSLHYTPLWIGKSLYTPHYSVKSAILSAKYSYLNTR